MSKDNVVIAHLLNGRKLKGRGEVVPEPRERAIYVLHEGGQYTVINTEALSHYEVIPYREESNGSNPNAAEGSR